MIHVGPIGSFVGQIFTQVCQLMATIAKLIPF
jgi:hypothetical protein